MRREIVFISSANDFVLCLHISQTQPFSVQVLPDLLHRSEHRFRLYHPPPLVGLPKHMHSHRYNEWEQNSDHKFHLTTTTEKNAWILVHVASQDLSLSPLTLVWERKRKLFSKIFFLLLSVERGDRRERFFSASEASVILLSSAEGIWKPTGHITHGYVALSAREKCRIFLIRKSMYRWQGLQNLILKTFNSTVIHLNLFQYL